MSMIQDGGPAFPVEWTNDSDVNLTAPNGRVTPPGGTEQLHGMTLRDYFAARAMQGMAAHPESDKWPADGIAKAAYQQADAMLEARREKP